MGKVEVVVNFMFEKLRKGWPFKLAGMHKSPVKNELDAPPGGTKVYTFKYCYTKAELQTIHDKLLQWVDEFSKGETRSSVGLDREVAIFGLGETWVKNWYGEH